MIPNPFYFAAWIGLLVTALNLIPSGQLDGGHAIFAVTNKKFHYWTGRIAFVVVATTSILGLVFLQQSERISVRRPARRNDARQTSRTARQDAARFQKKTHCSFDAFDFYSVRDAISDSDSVAAGNDTSR